MSTLDVPAEEGTHTLDGYEVTVEENDLVEDARENSGLFNYPNTFNEGDREGYVEVTHEKFTREEMKDLRNGPWELVRIAPNDEETTLVIQKE